MKIKLDNKKELGFREMYDFYKRTTLNPLSYTEYKNVNKAYITQLMDSIIDEGYNFKIPSYLGAFRIKKTKVNYDNLAIDWRLTKKEGFTIYHLNTHSDGFKIKFHWEKKKAIVKNSGKRPYSFTLAREQKRRLADNMKQQNAHSIYAEEYVPNR